MIDYTYSVSVKEEIIARGMTLENALILTRAIFQEYPRDVNKEVTISRVDDRCTVAESDYVCEGRDVY